MLEEHFFTCPHCGETISMLVELSEPRQDYVEDCEVCCAPILVKVSTRDGVLVEFSAEQA